MRTLHRHLKLQHHSHTGKLLHHWHTSYRALGLVIGLATATIIGLNILASVAADTINVYARFPAPIPTGPAVITEPSDGAVTTRTRIDVRGTCEVMQYALIITIMDNGELTGSSVCEANGTFAVQIVIDPGKHTLVARSLTITGDYGPDSTPVVIFRTLPGGVSVAPSAEPDNGNPLIVTIDTPFIVFGPAKNAVWRGTIKGGTPPYRVHVDWGDGNSDVYTIQTGGPQTFTHHYAAMKAHIIHMRVTDSAGRGALRSYAAVTPYIAPAAGGTTKLPWKGSLIWTLYGAYLLVLVVFGGTWVRTHNFAYATVPVRNHRTAVSAKHKRKTTHR